MWTPKTLENWHKESGQTWGQIAKNLGIGARHLRKIQHSQEGKKGLPVLKRSEGIFRRATTREAVEDLQKVWGVTRAETARRLGVKERHLRKILTETGKEKITALPTVEKILVRARREGVGSPRTRFFEKTLTSERIGKILAEMMNTTFRGMRKGEILRIAEGLLEDAGEDIESESWKIARDLYEELLEESIQEETQGEAE